MELTISKETDFKLIALSDAIFIGSMISSAILILYL